MRLVTGQRLIGASLLVVVTCAAEIAGLHALATDYLPASLGSDPAALETLLYFMQTAVVGLFGAVLWFYLTRYPESFFILWCFGWAAWVGLYTSRALDFRAGEVFNTLNSSFFLASGLTLLVRPLSLRRLRVPVYTETGAGSALRWLVAFLRVNPAALLLFVPVPMVFVLQRTNPLAARYVDSMFSVLAISSVGVGLYLRLWPTSVRGALTTLALHALYVGTRISRVWWSPDRTDTFVYVLTVAAPTATMKPALALVVTFVALRETAARRQQADAELQQTQYRVDEELRRKATMLTHLPDACLLVRDGRIVHANRRASELFGSTIDNRRIQSIFWSLSHYVRFSERLREMPATGVVGHDTLIAVSGSTSSHPVSLSMRLDAFYTSVESVPEAEREIVILLLDHHELELATAVYSLVHDYIKPRLGVLYSHLREVLGERRRIDAIEVFDGGHALGARELQECESLLSTMETLRAEFRGHFKRDELQDVCDVREVLNLAWVQAVRSCANLPCQASNQIAFDPDRELLLVPLSSRALEQCLHNVFRNAIQWTFEREANNLLKPLETTVTASEKWVRIRINDWGRGFSDSIRQYMNDNYGPGSGLGLGLIVLKLTAARTRGRVRVDNRPDRTGAWVEIVLPRVTTPLNRKI